MCFLEFQEGFQQHKDEFMFFVHTFLKIVNSLSIFLKYLKAFKKPFLKEKKIQF